MPGKNGDCAVKLLESHDPHQLVRPRHVTESEAQIGLGEKVRRQPIGAADENCEIRPALIAPAADALRECFAGQRFTAFVERERKLYAELVKRSGATVD